MPRCAAMIDYLENKITAELPRCMTQELNGTELTDCCMSANDRLRTTQLRQVCTIAEAQLPTGRWITPADSVRPGADFLKRGLLA
jgi:hypothetical protein